MIAPLILWILIFLLFVPFFVLFSIVFGVYRIIVNLIVWACHDEVVGHLTERDLAFTSDDFDGKVRKSVINTLIIEGHIPIRTYQDAVQKRILDKEFFYKLHCRPTCIMGYWFWEKTEIKIEDHITEWNEILTDDGLKQFLASWNQNRFKPDSPLWMAVLVPMTGGRSAVAFRMHHMVADGVSFMKLLENYVDGGWKNLETPKVNSLSWMHWIYAWYTFPWNALKNYRFARIRKGFRPAAYAGDSFFSWTALPLEKIRVIRRSTKCLFQSVLAGIMSNAFQTLLENTGRGDKIPAVLRVVSPIPWPNRSQKTLSNHVAWLHVDLCMGGGVNSILQYNQNVKNSYTLGMHGVFWHLFRWTYLIPGPLLRKYCCWGERNLPPIILSSIPGTMSPISMCGKKVVHAFPCLNLGCTTGVNAVIATYADSAYFMMRVSKEIVPSQELTDQLLGKYLHEELDIIYQQVLNDEKNEKKLSNEVCITMTSS